MQSSTHQRLDFLHVVTYFGLTGEYGGPIAVALNLNAELSRLNFNSVIICGSTGKFETQDSHFNSIIAVPVKSLIKKFHFSSMWSIKVGVKLYNNIKIAKLVHIHFARDLIPVVAALICIIKGKSFVVQTHGMLSSHETKLHSFFDRCISGPILRKAEMVLCLTAKEESDLSRFGIRNLQILPNGIKVNSKFEVKRHDSAIKVIFYSRIEKRKNLKCFIDVAQISQELGLSYSFEIYGPDEGDLEGNLQLIEKLKLTNVHYKGPISLGDALTLLASKDILILPSLEEPWAMVVLEALSVGTRVIIYPSGGIAPIIRTRFPEFVTQAENALAVFQRLAQMNQQTSSLMRIGIADFCEEEFSISTVVSKYLQLLAISKKTG